VLRRRSGEELTRVDHPDYWVFMAVVDRAGVDARGNRLFERSPDGTELIFDDEVIERVRVGGNVQSQKVWRKQRHVDDELPAVAQHYRAFIDGGRQGP
jgi:type I restriction enzyme M protein